MNLKTYLTQLDVTALAIDELDELIKQMFDQIGVPDPELRDKLIYKTFAKLIKGDYLSPDQMKSILEVSIDGEHLFLHIGKTNHDSVFTRSFSALVAALVLNKDRIVGFLSDQMVLLTLHSSLRYLVDEKDTRGYVPTKGWAHSIAHGADLLASVIQHPLYKMEESHKCLQAITSCLWKDTTYIDDEDERLIVAIEALLKKGVEEDFINTWLVQLSDDLSSYLSTHGFSLQFFRKKYTVMTFLKTLYFRLLFKKRGSAIKDCIEQIMINCYQKL
ncbi:hypothetical protein HNQ94_001180 [Salirhabdus euzebyi]|uniref:DUF2785 domain-containing protein n=1 Tax=Salirhabdus euzebyi TaxID=394506 RepID=A0A841PXH2_9BACI|nr:DUF2785 domain-containing protein [Salirhabdus euzebyi]MBB6452734.1 hypothetical protein [Salirhabdus euzebyi]